MSEVITHRVRGQFDPGLDLMTTQEVVLARDYAALEAECANLKNSLLAITARHFAESWKKRTSDAELEQYLSAGIAQLEAERDTLRQQLAERDAELKKVNADRLSCWAEFKVMTRACLEAEKQRDKLAGLLQGIRTMNASGLSAMTKEQIDTALSELTP